MKRYIVNPRYRTVREFGPTIEESADVRSDEFYFVAPTATDAMQAGQRRLLAEKALAEESVAGHVSYNRFVVAGDRIECQAVATAEVAWRTRDLESALIGLGYDVWREGAALVVLGGPQPSKNASDSQ